MNKKYYVKRWKYLDKKYKELTEINKKINENPNNIDFINQKILILRDIKYFLRYKKHKYKYYKS